MFARLERAPERNWIVSRRNIDYVATLSRPASFRSAPFVPRELLVSREQNSRPTKKITMIIIISANDDDAQQVH